MILKKAHLKSLFSYSRQLVFSPVHSSTCHSLQLSSINLPKIVGAGIKPKKRKSNCMIPVAYDP